MGRNICLNPTCPGWHHKNGGVMMHDVENFCSIRRSRGKYALALSHWGRPGEATIARTESAAAAMCPVSRIWD